MELLDFMPGVAQNTQARFRKASFDLLRHAPHLEVCEDIYLMFHVDMDAEGYKYSGTFFIYDIKELLQYVARYGEDCQVMLLKVDDNEPIVELLY